MTQYFKAPVAAEEFKKKKMNKIKWISIVALVFYFLVICSTDPASSQELKPSLSTKTQPPPQRLTVEDAAICEEVRDYRPYSRTISISILLGQAICYSSFDPVPEKTFIYHNWYHSDILTASVKLQLQPPRWATFSTIRLREADKGPWRVEIIDKNGTIFQVLRFSITD